MIEVKLTCPFGSTCEEIIDGVIHRCRWFIELEGIKADGEMTKQRDCAIAVMPMLQIEVAMTNRGQTAALESLRNETIERQDRALRLIDV